MTDLVTSAPVTHADPTLRLRRALGAAALPLGIVFQIAANALYAVASADGGTDTGTGDQALEFYAEHGNALRGCAFLAIVGAMLLIPGLLAAMRFLRSSSPKLMLVTGVLMIGGYVSYFGVVMGSFTTAALASGGVDAGAALDAASNDPYAMPWFFLFIVGNLPGTVLLAIAMLRAASVPRIAGILVLAWPVGHITNLVVGNEWFAVAGGTVQAVGLVMLAAAMLKAPTATWAKLG